MAAAGFLSFVQTPAGQLGRGHGSETNARGTARETRASVLVSVTLWDIGNENLHRCRSQAGRRLVSYLVRITPQGNVRVSTRFRFTQLSSAVKNGVPLPTRTGAVGAVVG
jgi:hypothetical protein